MPDLNFAILFQRKAPYRKGGFPIYTCHFNMTIYITLFITHSFCISQEKMQKISSGKKKLFTR